MEMCSKYKEQGDDSAGRASTNMMYACGSSRARPAVRIHRTILDSTRLLKRGAPRRYLETNKASGEVGRIWPQWDSRLRGRITTNAQRAPPFGSLGDVYTPVCSMLHPYRRLSDARHARMMILALLIPLLLLLLLLLHALS